MKKKLIISLAIVVIGLIIGWSIWALMGLSIPLLSPKGIIGLKQRNLLFTATLLMLIVVIPVFIFTLAFIWKYRHQNKNAKYTPDWEHSHLAEALWWGIPFLIIIVLAVITWKSSHDLSPYKPIVNGEKPIEVQVVALQWKWLFIYPEYEIATVNYIAFPEKTPIHFQITADAPMNSFWIPQLGGQIYAMPGMKSTLYLIADEKGIYRGCSANLSGTGFAGMSFNAEAMTKDGFKNWVKSANKSPKSLTMAHYNRLVKPSQYDPVALYQLKAKDLFDQIIMKYNMPATAN
jgi:cytochrome o ubiquinol oxidase subunit 2